jgi:hypothetical protein
MYDIEALAKLFDLLSGPVFDSEKPTKTSIEKINEHFGIELPADFIRFAEISNNFGAWYSSLGEDYLNPFHIIRINRIYRRMRRKKHGDKWRPAKPNEYIVINHGHDDDCDCIDAGDWNEKESEYRIIYWCPGIEKIEYRYDSFSHYLNNHVEKSIKYHTNNVNRSGSLRSTSRNIVECINEILQK